MPLYPQKIADGKPDLYTPLGLNGNNPLVAGGICCLDWLGGRNPYVNWADLSTPVTVTTSPPAVVPKLVDTIDGEGSEFPALNATAYDAGPDVWIDSNRAFTIIVRFIPYSFTSHPALFSLKTSSGEPLIALFGPSTNYGDLTIGGTSFGSGTWPRIRCGNGFVILGEVNTIAYTFNGGNSVLFANYRFYVNSVLVTNLGTSSFTTTPHVNTIGNAGNIGSIDGVMLGMRVVLDYFPTIDEGIHLTDKYYTPFESYVVELAENEVYLPATAVVPGVTIDVPASTLDLSSPVPAVASGVTVSVPQFNLEFTLPIPGVAAGASVDVPALNYELTFPVPTVSAGTGVFIEVPVFNVDLQTPVPDVATGVSLEVPVFLLDYSLPTPTVIAETPVNIEVPWTALQYSLPQPVIDVVIANVEVPEFNLSFVIPVPTSSGIPLPIDINVLDLTPTPELDRNTANWLVRNFEVIQNLLNMGARGSFTTADNKTIVVSDGIVRKINDDT